jgi:hypothetical protein
MKEKLFDVQHLYGGAVIQVRGLDYTKVFNYLTVSTAVEIRFYGTVSVAFNGQNLKRAYNRFVNITGSIFRNLS